MLHRVAPAYLLLLTTTAFAFQGEGATFKSGPQKGALLRAAFHPFNLNGPIGKDRHHCLVCEYALNPVVMIFARERADGKDKALDDLLQGVEKALTRDTEGYLKGFVVFLSKDFRSSVTEGKVTDPKELVEEASARAALLARLRERMDRLQLKNLIVSCYSAAEPPGYDLSPQAEVTVVLYVKHKVVDNFAYPEGKLTDKDVSSILQAVDALAGRARKKAPAKKGEAPKTASRGLRLELDILGRESIPDRPAGVFIDHRLPCVRIEPLAEHTHLDSVVGLVILQDGKQVLT
jgi:hypothetical protein